MFENIRDFIRSLYPNEDPIPLHAPRFQGNEKKYLNDCIDSTYVSYVGKYVTDFENHIKTLTRSKHAIAMVNGTAALHLTLLALGIGQSDEVITQALTFAATANAIRHANAMPVFIDVDKETMGMSPISLRLFFEQYTLQKDNKCFNKNTGKRIAACIPMHTFGHPVKIDEIIAICRMFNVTVIEDAAEALGSTYNNIHLGTFGTAGIISFNGNKPVTTGGGGMVITNDDSLAASIRHLATTAKTNHPWEFFHDEVGYNYRMPNINAAIGCAQMEYYSNTLRNKRETASMYIKEMTAMGVQIFCEPPHAFSNYWLNAILLKNRSERDLFLEYMNTHKIQTRPIWTLMNKLPAFESCFSMPLDNAQWFEDCVVNLPSSVRLNNE